MPGAHLVGSVPLADAEAVFRTVAGARRFAPRFGAASECGWGRADPQRVPGLLESHRIAAEALNGR